ncbi:MAG TPA: DUF4145 domain-containing protein [Candidatus Hydrogenedentes bacterium]|nr:DUF4145 domain-containing protein [Candidatus Hydrogenedentota bacterium]
MDILTFVTEMVKSLAWPIASIAIILLLRRSLLTLIPNLKRLQYKEFAAEFDRDLKKADEQVAEINPPPVREAEETPMGIPEPAAQKYRRLADASPKAAIIEAWRDVEVALLDAAGVRDSEATLPRVLDKLFREGKLDTGEKHFLEYMRMIRNKAAHATDLDLTADQAYRYAILTTQMTIGLRTRTKPNRGVVIRDV